MSTNMMLYGSLLPIGILFFSNRLCITCINIFFFRNLVEEGSRDWTKLMCWQFDETPAFLLFLQPISVRVRCSESILSHTPLKKKIVSRCHCFEGISQFVDHNSK